MPLHGRMSSNRNYQPLSPSTINYKMTQSPNHSFLSALDVILNAPVEPFVINTRFLGLSTEAGQKQNILYPLLHVDGDCQMTASTVGTKLDASFVILDQATEESTATMGEVAAQCEEMARKIIAHLASKEIDLLDFPHTATITPLIQAYADNVTGVSVNLTLSYGRTISNC